jgi:hypothetical protein
MLAAASSWQGQGSFLISDALLDPAMDVMPGFTCQPREGERISVRNFNDTLRPA